MERHPAFGEQGHSLAYTRSHDTKAACRFYILELTKIGRRIRTTNKSCHVDYPYLSKWSQNCKLQCTSDTSALEPTPPSPSPRLPPRSAPNTFAPQLRKDHIANDLCRFTGTLSISNERIHLGAKRELSASACRLLPGR